jgi:hypothetical protein
MNYPTYRRILLQALAAGFGPTRKSAHASTPAHQHFGTWGLQPG